MKNQPSIRRRALGIIAGAVLAAVLIPAARAQTDMIDPTGAIYTGISTSSEFSTAYGPENLFNTDLTGLAAGAALSGGDWADSGATLLLGPAYVAFQVDQSYQVGGIYYAQRAGNSGNPVDKITSMSVWASLTTPFDPNNPPTNAPNAIIPVPDQDGAVLHRYLLSAPINGQYFLVKVSQNPTVKNSNIGGNEMRLGLVPAATPPVIVQQPVSATIYTGGTAHFSVTDTGPVASTYQWKKGGTPLSNGGRISGATSANFAISLVTNTDVAVYSCSLSNLNGVTNTVGVNLTVTTPPTNPDAKAILAAGPAAYWELNEAAGATVASDFAGGYNGTYGTSSGTGAVGPQAPQFLGFTTSNSAVQTFAFTIPSAVNVPALNLTGTNVTLLAWVYPNPSDTAQSPYTAVFYCRSTSTSAGLIFSSDGTKLAYQWAGNRYFFDSGLVVPSGQWSLLAMSVTASNCTLYCGTSNSVRSAVDTIAEPAQKFEGPGYIGLDTDVGESSRTFDGTIDDVAIFNRALSELEIDTIFAAATGGITPLPVQVTAPPASQNVLVGDSFTLNAQATGTPPLLYQWYQNSTAITGATNSSYSVSGATTNAAGNYYVAIHNQVSATNSAAALVTILTKDITVIDPTGVLYTSISASSSYPGGGYGPTNLFDANLTGIAVGSALAGGDWADDGVGAALGPAYLAFQLDKSYPVAGVFYAQRNGAFGGATDKITAMSIWISQTTPFDPLNPPVTPPDLVLSITAVDAAVLHRYLAASTVSGQYFLVKVEQNPTVTSSNIGGNEFRLGTPAVTLPPFTFSHTGSGLVLNWTGGTLCQADDLNGTWVPATNVVSGAPISTTAPHRYYRVKY